MKTSSVLRVSVYALAVLQAAALPRMGCASPVPSAIPTAFPIQEYANGRDLLAGVVIDGHRQHYMLSAAKTSMVRGNQYWIIPVENMARVVAIGRIAVFKASGNRLQLIALLPKGDSNSRYGYGNDLRNDRLQLERPYDQPGKKCCKSDKYYEYQIVNGSAKLLRVHFELELP